MPMHRHLPILLLALALAHTVAADDAGEKDPAARLPASTMLFISVDNLATWRNDLMQDPFAALAAGGFTMQGDGPRSWRRVRRIMQMTGPELADRYLGDRFVIAADGVHPGAPIILLSRVSDANRDTLVDRCGLRQVDAGRGVTIFTTHDDGVSVAMRRDWIAISSKAHHQHLIQSMEDRVPGQTLADDPTYQRMMAAMPVSSLARVYLRPAADHVHAASVVRDGHSIMLTYRGVSPQATQWIRRQQPRHQQASPPIPPGAMAVLSLNIINRAPAGTDAIDRLLAPKSYTRDILPKLAEPMVAFVCRDQANAGDQNDAFLPPAVGLALHMSDATLANDLNLILRNMVLARNALLESDDAPAAIRAAKHGDVMYYVADIGEQIVRQTGMQDLGNVRLTFGAVGEWYVVCTSESAFVACANSRGTRPAPVEPDHRAPGLVIASVRIMPVPLAEQMKSWANHAATREANVVHEDRYNWQYRRPLRVHEIAHRLAQTLETYDDVNLAVSVTDGDVITGRLKIAPK